MTPPMVIKEDLTLAELVSTIQGYSVLVWRNRRILLQAIATAGVVGLILAFAAGTEFTAQTRLLPYRSGGGGVGLSGLAGLAGIRLPSGAADQTITADLYPEVAKSQDFRLAVAETPILFGSMNKRATFVEYFRDLHEKPVSSLVAEYTIGLPDKLLSSLRGHDSVSTDVHESDKDSTRFLQAFDPEYLQIVNLLEERLFISIEKRTSVITISGIMPDPYASADLVRVASERLMERIIDYESRKASEQFHFINEQYNQAKMKYERAQRELASYSDRNRSLMSATAQIDRDRLQRDYDLAFEVYQQFSRELEQARIKMNQDTPVFTTLEKVIVPTNHSSPKRAQIFVAALLLGALIGVSRIALRHAIASPPLKRAA